MAGLARPPDEPGELYLARGDEVNDARPVMTGDVFADVEIPGVGGGRGLAMVLAHPCSMRRGAHLRDHIMMCAVRKGAPIAPDHWLGNFGVLPLPDLLQDGGLKLRAEFELAGRVPTVDLALANRQSCLDDQGIVLLLQRLTFNLTRLVVELETIHQSIAHVLEEAALLEEWAEARTTSAGRLFRTREMLDAEISFDELLGRVDPGAGISHRDRLRDPMARASVRRLVRRTLLESG